MVWGTRLRGSALAEQGYVEEGIEQMQQGMSALQAMGTEAARAIYLADLAAAYAKVERVAEGLDLLVEALARVEKTDGRVWEAELYRLKGELTLQQLKIKNAKLKITETQDPTASFQGAEVCFLKAIEIARRQQAKSLELRATMSLARLWQQQGKQHKAHNMLSGGYSWFTEGFDTKDLQEAKALLEDLGRKAKRGNGETDERKTS